MRRVRAGEAGVTIVEAAFVIPLLFMFMFGLVDLGMWTLNSNQASNAARDGARVGILEFPLRGGDLATAEDNIVEAIEDHLPEGTMDASDVTITCLASDDATIPCTNPKPDRVKVDVAWEWRLVTPVATILGIDEGDVQGSATMEIVGRPVPGNGGVDPDTPDPLNPDPVLPCSIADLVAPPEVFTRGQQLAGPMLIEFRYVSGDCSDLQVVLTGTKAAGAETFTHVCGCGDPPNHIWEYAGSNNIWKANGNRGVVSVYNGSDRTGAPLAREEFAVR
jgi:Flp pilus assembly protein TadG